MERPENTLHKSHDTAEQSQMTVYQSPAGHTAHTVTIKAKVDYVLCAPPV